MLIEFKLSFIQFLSQHQPDGAAMIDSPSTPYKTKTYIIILKQNMVHPHKAPATNYAICMKQLFMSENVVAMEFKFSVKLTEKLVLDSIRNHFFLFDLYSNRNAQVTCNQYISSKILLIRLYLGCISYTRDTDAFSMESRDYATSDVFIKGVGEE